MADSFFQFGWSSTVLYIDLLYQPVRDEMPPRRNRIPLEHRERIVRAFKDEDEDYLMVADTHGVNRSTARGIVAQYIREGRIQ